MNLSDLPIHLQQVIKGVRTITAKSLKPIKGKCTWCRAPVKPPKRNWCSDRCVNMFLALAKLPETIVHRDKGLCRECGVDVIDLNRIINSWGYYGDAEKEAIIAKYPDWFSNGRHRFAYSYDIDHVVPVHLGGTSTADNLVTLCKVCHLRKTSLEASSRAEKKRNKRL